MSVSPTFAAKLFFPPLIDCHVSKLTSCAPTSSLYYLDALPNTVIATLEEKDVIQPFVLVSIVGI